MWQGPVLSAVHCSSERLPAMFLGEGVVRVSLKGCSLRGHGRQYVLGFWDTGGHLGLYMDVQTHAMPLRFWRIAPSG